MKVYPVTLRYRCCYLTMQISVINFNIKTGQCTIIIYTIVALYNHTWLRQLQIAQVYLYIYVRYQDGRFLHQSLSSHATRLSSKLSGELTKSICAAIDENTLGQKVAIAQGCFSKVKLRIN